DEAKKNVSPEAAAKAMAEAATPGPEHQKLQPLAGSWNFTGKFWMDPSAPAMETKGTIERKWILGGRVLEEKVAGTNFDGKPGFEGCGVIGYDNSQKKFNYGFACTMNTALDTGMGTCDASGKTFTFTKEAYCPVRQQKIKCKDVIRIESNDKNVMESY